jgi:hypothetical protein
MSKYHVKISRQNLNAKFRVKLVCQKVQEKVRVKISKLEISCKKLHLKILCKILM